MVKCGDCRPWWRDLRHGLWDTQDYRVIDQGTFYPAQIVANELPGAPLITVDSPAADLVEGCCYGKPLRFLTSRENSEVRIDLDGQTRFRQWSKRGRSRKADVRWIAGAIPALGEMVAGLLELSCLESGRLARTDIIASWLVIIFRSLSHINFEPRYVDGMV